MPISGPQVIFYTPQSSSQNTANSSTMGWTTDKMSNLTGHTLIVTGANTGLGKITARWSLSSRRDSKAN